MGRTRVPSLKRISAETLTSPRSHDRQNLARIDTLIPYVIMMLSYAQV